MNAAAVSALLGWITEAGLAGKGEAAMLDGFCHRALDAGLPLPARASSSTRCIRSTKGAPSVGAAKTAASRS